MLVYNVYGWTNGATVKLSAERTAAILQAIFSDVELQPKGPVLIVGDLNGDLDSFKILKSKLEENWVNIGSQAHQWGNTKDDYTCRAPFANSPSIRDYAIANIAGPSLSLKSKEIRKKLALHKKAPISMKSCGASWRNASVMQIARKPR